MMKMDWLLDLLFPPKCPFCGRVTDRREICPACRRELTWAEDHLQMQILSGKIRCVSPLFYQGVAREGVLNLKFHGMSGAAEPLGREIADCAARWYSGEFDTVTWVPVSPKRLRDRGYDQARLLAEAACRCWDIAPVLLLRKTVHNPEQSGQRDAAARRANVLGVYEADEGRTVGHRILLVDDVVTTGSTLSECARVLRDAGAADVMCVTLARTPAEGEEPR